MAGMDAHLVDVKGEQAAHSHEFRAARAGDSHEDDDQHQRHAALPQDILQQQEPTFAHALRRVTASLARLAAMVGQKPGYMSWMGKHVARRACTSPCTDYKQMLLANNLHSSTYKVAFPDHSTSILTICLCQVAAPRAECELGHSDMKSSGKRPNQSRTEAAATGTRPCTQETKMMTTHLEQRILPPDYNHS